MNMDQIIQHYRRFRRWQQEEPHYVNRHEGEMQHCHNCGIEFADNFCPRCGQRAEVGRVGWQSIRENVALLCAHGDCPPVTWCAMRGLGGAYMIFSDYIRNTRFQKWCYTTTTASRGSSTAPARAQRGLALLCPTNCPKGPKTCRKSELKGTKLMRTGPTGYAVAIFSNIIPR